MTLLQLTPQILINQDVISIIHLGVSEIAIGLSNGGQVLRFVSAADVASVKAILAKLDITT